MEIEDHGQEAHHGLDLTLDQDLTVGHHQVDQDTDQEAVVEDAPDHTQEASPGLVEKVDHGMNLILKT